MGASDSLPLPRYSCCIRPENSSDGCCDSYQTTTMLRPSTAAAAGPTSSAAAAIGMTSAWRRRHRRNVSATFSLTDSTGSASCPWSTASATAVPFNTTTTTWCIDVNEATEEELMTLSGINRHTARNIVDYRRRIGGFRKVEDVALVSGVGAMRLAAIRSELCVRGPRSRSSRFSRQHDQLTEEKSDAPCVIGDDSSADQSMSSSGIFADDSQTPVDVNTASAVELLQVPLIDRTLADHIVTHRHRRGAFIDLDELLIVDGVTPSVLAAVRPHLTVSQVVRPPMMVDQSAAEYPDDEALARDLVTQFRLLFGDVSRTTFYRRHMTNAAPLETGTGLRLATWNLDDCNSQKFDNPGVREVVAMTILENRLSLIALQGITDHCVLYKLCSELNEPTLGSVKRWTERLPTKWKYIVASDSNKNYVGVVYNSENGIKVQPTDVSDLSLPVNVLHIAVGSLEFVLVNVFIPSCSPQHDADSCAQLATLRLTLDNIREQHVVVCAGNVSCCAPDLSQSAIAPMTPVIDAAEGRRSDNIWLSQTLYSHSYTGESGVICEGLTSPWIPDGWQWGGAASKYQPAWLRLRY